MGRKLREALPWGYLQHVLVAVLVAATLGLVIWAGGVAWQYYPCRDAGVSLITGSTECPSLLLDLVPLVVALGFWAACLAAWFTGHRFSTIAFFLLSAGTLAAGKLSSMENDVGKGLFYLLLAWLAPVLLHFHLVLLDRVPGRLARGVLAALYILTAAWSPPFLLLPPAVLQQRGWFTVLRPGVRLTLALSIVLTTGFLLWDYHRCASSAARRRVRLILFGILLAFAPFLLLYLLPDTFGWIELPYEWTLPWLLLLPLFCVYPLFRRQSVRAEAAFRRLIVYYLLVVLILSVYFAAFGALTIIATDLTFQWQQISISFLLSAGLLLLFAPLRQGVERLTNWVWYGSEVSYISLTEHLLESLPTTLDRETLRHLLIEELAAAMYLTKSALLLKDQENQLVLLGYIGFDLQDITACQLSGKGDLATYLQAATRPVPHDQVRQALAETSRHPGEQAWLSRADVTFWLPLASGDVLQGLLLIGPRQRNADFTAEDERILATVARQSGIAAHNVRLVEQVQAGRQELAQAHRQLLVGREREQRRLAHDLHDSVVQQLIGISYQIAESRRRVDNGGRAVVQDAEELASTLEGIRRGVLDVVAGLRSLIGELRPAGLEELGLTTALEGYVARLKREGEPGMSEIHLDLDKDLATVQDSIAICLFRITQEALRNALKHAHAQHVTISLHLLADEATLCVRDDGCGFRVPARLSQLTQNGHFGLVGMSERVTWAGGRLAIRSEPGEGTEVVAQIPLNGGETGYGGVDSRSTGR